MFSFTYHVLYVYVPTYVCLIYVAMQADGCLARNRTTAKLYNFTTYNNGIHGLEFSVVGHVQIHGFKVADNRDNGIEIQETHGFWGGPLIKVRTLLMCIVALVVSCCV